jgi:hypothetical protein
VATLWAVKERPGPTTPGRRGAPADTTEPTDDASEDATAAET